MASICSVTRMLPSSAPMLLPILPAQIKAVITGAISRTMLMATMAGNMLSAPKRAKVGRLCTVSTKPMMKAVIPTKGKVSAPFTVH